MDHHRERIQNFRKVGNLKHLYRNKLDQACFTHDVAYYDSEDLSKRTISAKILKERELIKLLEIVKMMDINEH